MAIREVDFRKIDLNLLVVFHALMREQSVAAGEVQHLAAAEAPAHPPRDLPRLEELLPRQASCTAHHAPDAVEEGRPGEPTEIARGELRSAPRVEFGLCRGL